MRTSRSEMLSIREILFGWRMARRPRSCLSGAPVVVRYGINVGMADIEFSSDCCWGNSSRPFCYHNALKWGHTPPFFFLPSNFSPVRWTEFLSFWKRRVSKKEIEDCARDHVEIMSSLFSRWLLLHWLGKDFSFQNGELCWFVLCQCCSTVRGVANGGAGGADCPPGHQKSGRRAKIGKGKKGERKEKRGKGREKGRKKREKEKRKGKRKRGRKREKGKERKREEKKGEKGRKGGEEKGEEREEKRKKMLINIIFHRYLNISNGMNFA